MKNYNNSTKIGILTFLGASNCGAVLQAYALQNVLHSLGYSSEVIQYRKKYPFRLRTYIRKTPAASYSLWKSHFLKFLYKEKNIRCLKLSKKRYRSLQDLQNDKLDYDIYITGSDQIWNSEISVDGQLDPVFFGAFIPAHAKLVSYAASMGQGKDLGKYPDKLHHYLERYHAISIREEHIAKTLGNLTGRNVSVCIDPTLLLPAPNYNNLIQICQENELSAPPYIASYVLYPINTSKDYIEKYVQENNLHWLNLINSASGENFKKACNIRVTPEKWLYYIKNSQCVICSSFHAVVFSLIFHKPFVYICPEYQKNGNMRILSLLGILGLQNRHLSELNDNTASLLSQEIDWMQVDRIIQKQREFSLDFLRKALIYKETKS